MSDGINRDTGAAIVIGPNGVDVKPIIDITKLTLTSITTWVAMLAIVREIKKLER